MPTPTPLWFGVTGLTVQVDSGKLTLADRSTLVDVYQGMYVSCVAAIVARGVFGTGLRAGFVCASSVAEQIDRGNRGRLTINWEAGGPFATLPLPSDDFDLQPQELYPRIERNPFFSGINTQTLALAYAAVNGPTDIARAQAATRVAGLTAPQSTLGAALIAKLQKGEETFYMAYARYIWWSFSYLPPPWTLGGIISSPGGPLAAYFGAFSCLRLADAIQPAGVNGSMFKLIRTWLVAPNGYWDPDLNG